MKLRLCILGLIPAIGVTPVAATPIYSTDFESPTHAGGAQWSHTIRRELGGPYSTVLGRFGSATVDLDLFATPENTGGLGGGSGADRFNIGVGEFRWNRRAEGVPDSGTGGGGSPGGTNHAPGGPSLDLGGAIGNGGGGVIFGAGTYALTFDLMLFDSWDAGYEGYGPDSFAVEINGERKFDELLEVHWLPNNFRMPDELPELNVFNTVWQDQIYRDIRLEFEVTEATERFGFSFIGTTSQAIIDESWGLDNVRVEQVSAARGASVPAVPAPGALTLLGLGLGLRGRRGRRD